MESRKMRFDRVIKGGHVVHENGVFAETIGIIGEKIAAIFQPDVAYEAAEEIDATGCVVFPGLIDPHVHLWEPGPLSYREDFRCGSQAAAAGGVTTLIEMPLSIPPVIDDDSFQLKLNTASSNSVVDFALWGGMIPKSVNNLERLHELGCVGFKAFMSYANSEYPHTPDHYLVQAMQNTAKFDGMIGVHAENADVVDYASKRLEQSGVMDPEAHADGRPALAELDAIQRAILFARETNCRLYIVHMSVAEGGEMVKRAKDQGIRVSNETCPHYLVFDRTELKKRGSFAKCNPPLRSRENVEQLWEQLLKGNVDCIGSDHGPYTDEEKQEHGDNIWKAPSGFGGIELILPVMLSEGYHKRGLGLEKIARLTSTNAARTFGLYPRKGTISVGSDADLTLVDLNERWTYSGAHSFSKTKSVHGPYEGLEFTGRVKTTLVRGSIIFRNEEIKVSPGYGEFVSFNRQRVSL